MPLNDWKTLYRWDWFRRDAWRAGFREQKRGKFGGSCACVAQIAGEFGPGARVLDCSCGLGLKTIVLAEMGVNVTGSDGCAFAVEKARELARLEGLTIDYFVSRWAALPSRAPERFDVIFNDALSWTTTRAEFEKSLAGFLGALSPGGALVFMGAPEGAPDPPDHPAKLLYELMARRARFELEWTHEADGTRCTAMVFRERREAAMDEHHVFLIDPSTPSPVGTRGGASRAPERPRIETATIRQPVCWGWPVLAELFDRAGFASLHTREFPSRAADGGPVRLNIARRER